MEQKSDGSRSSSNTDASASEKGNAASGTGKPTGNNQEDPRVAMARKTSMARVGQAQRILTPQRARWGVVERSLIVCSEQQRNTHILGTRSGTSTWNLFPGVFMSNNSKEAYTAAIIYH